MQNIYETLCTAKKIKQSKKRKVKNKTPNRKTNRMKASKRNRHRINGSKGRMKPKKKTLEHDPH